MKRLANRHAKRIRRGISTVEMAAILALIAVAVVVGAALLGGQTATQSQTTADGVGDPAQLQQYFDNMGGGGS